MPDCNCEGDGCILETPPSNQCDEGISCEPYYDTCICGWSCSSDPEAEPQCDQICPQEELGPTPVCVECDDGSCLPPAQCIEGDTQEAGDGCNRCTCVKDSGSALNVHA